MYPWKSRLFKYRGRLLFFHKHRGRLENLALRFLYATSSAAKLIFWGGALALGKWRERARLELKSHSDILRMALSPLQAH
jgi:hypothetical protein